MTKAEAAEIIMGCNPWRSCDVCSGTGYHNPRMKRFCKACKGTGVKLKLKYRYAYMKLNMLPPSVTTENIYKKCPAWLALLAN